MKAIVCVKQVPDTSGKVAVKADGTLDRASMATITNPDDLNALEAALKLKDATGCEVVVVTMGPPPAEGMLRELLARGADKAVLVSGVSSAAPIPLQPARSWLLLSIRSEPPNSRPETRTALSAPRASSSRSIPSALSLIHI